MRWSGPAGKRAASCERRWPRATQRRVAALSMATGSFDEATYFGLWSADQRARVVQLLSSLGVRFDFLEVHESEERLRAWTAWDESSAHTLMGYELFVQTADLDKLGTKLVEVFPERKFGAP